MRRAAVLVVMLAATAYAGGWAYVAEAGGGLVGGGAGAAAAYFAVDAIHYDEGAGTWALVSGYFLGNAAGTWLTGELLDGRSANPSVSFFGSLGGSALGFVLGAGVMVLGVVVRNSVDDEGTGFLVFLLGEGVVVAGPPVLSTVIYNAVKTPAAPDVGGITVAPTIAALPPRAPGEAPTLTFGLAAAF